MRIFLHPSLINFQSKISSSDTPKSPALEAAIQKISEASTLPTLLQNDLNSNDSSISDALNILKSNPLLSSLKI